MPRSILQEDGDKILLESGDDLLLGVDWLNDAGDGGGPWVEEPGVGGQTWTPTTQPPKTWTRVTGG